MKKKTNKKQLDKSLEKKLLWQFKEVITELKQPSLSSQKQPIQEKKNLFTKFCIE